MAWERQELVKKRYPFFYNGTVEKCNGTVVGATGD